MTLPPRSAPTKLQAFGAIALLGGALATTGCGGRDDAAPPPQLPPSGVSSPSPGARLPREAIRYRLPVDGVWRVFRTHYDATNDQAFALDLIVDESLNFGRKRGKRANQDYPTYGKPIVADAPGIIAIAVDGVPDNDPGIINRYDIRGNYVVIDHENGEYSQFSHLIPGSIAVRVGQRVEAGAQLGLCGNSGQSSMPHLHWQVMDNVNANLARAVRPRYLPYERNGQTTVELPDKGDTVETE